MAKARWTVAEAKAKFSEVLERAEKEGPQRITKHGRETAVALSVITLAELRYGIERLAPGAKRERLTRWLEDELPRRFDRRILRIDDFTAAEWGRTMARAERVGRPMSEMDAWLAALAS